MASRIPVQNTPRRRVPSGRGDVVYAAYWFAAIALGAAALLGVPLGQAAAVAVGAVVFIGGGLPHGAYDIALLRRVMLMDRNRLTLAVAGYVLTAVSMAILWRSAPLVALILFLAVAAVHFGEDWPMLEEPLLRVAAGAAVIAAPTIGHPAEVSALFVAMSDTRATVIAQIITAAAPVTLLVTAVGIVVAWRDGSRHWAAAMALCLALLLVLPPVWGFALFFVFLHSPRHLAQTRVALHGMTRRRWLGTGAALSVVTVLGWCGLQWIAPPVIGPPMVAQAFQLLASVAVPHLLLSRWIERRLDQAGTSSHSVPQEETALQ